MKIGAIIQSRMGSSRLPGKALIDVYNKPALQRVIERVKQAKSLDVVIVATTVNEKDDPIIDLCEKLKCDYYRGSEDDVLKRVLEAAQKFDLDVICEVTADCLLLDHVHIDHLVNLFLQGGYDHVSNIVERGFPRGYDIRVFSREALERTDKEVDNAVDRQHCSTWQYLHPRGKQNYKCLNWFAPPEQNRTDIEVVLDTPEDLELLRWLFSFEGQGYNLALTCEEVINILDVYKDLPVCQAAKEVPRKDYFAELSEWYKKHDEGAKKEDAKVQCPDSGGRKPGGFKRYTGKPKSKQGDKLRPRGKRASGV